MNPRLQPSFDAQGRRESLTLIFASSWWRSRHASWHWVEKVLSLDLLTVADPPREPQRVQVLGFFVFQGHVFCVERWLNSTKKVHVKLRAIKLDERSADVALVLMEKILWEEKR